MPRHSFTEYGDYPDHWPTVLVHEFEDAMGKLAKWVPCTVLDLASLTQLLLVALQHEVPPQVLREAIIAASGLLVQDGPPTTPDPPPDGPGAPRPAIPDTDPRWADAVKQHATREL